MRIENNKSKSSTLTLQKIDNDKHQSQVTGHGNESHNKRPYMSETAAALAPSSLNWNSISPMTAASSNLYMAALGVDDFSKTIFLSLFDRSFQDGRAGKSTDHPISCSRNRWSTVSNISNFWMFGWVYAVLSVLPFFSWAQQESTLAPAVLTLYQLAELLVAYSTNTTTATVIDRPSEIRRENSTLSFFFVWSLLELPPGLIWRKKKKERKKCCSQIRLKGGNGSSYSKLVARYWFRYILIFLPLIALRHSLLLPLLNLSMAVQL